MVNQPEHEHRTPQELRQALQAELEAIKQGIQDLSDEELEAASGGKFLSFSGIKAGFKKVFRSGKTPSSNSRSDSWFDDPRFPPGAWH